MSADHSVCETGSGVRHPALGSPSTVINSSESASHVHCLTVPVIPAPSVAVRESCSSGNHTPEIT